MPFYNPYHFVSVKKDKRIDDFAVEKFESEKFSTHKHLQQDRFLNELKTGRIVCRITTESPIVVGNIHNERSEPTRVEQYYLDDKPAIPATSLRGMISSIVEASTNSSLKVLNRNEFYSYRKTMTQGLSAIGMIILQDGNLKLRPLVLPTINGIKGSSVKTTYQKVFEKPNLKVHINQNGNYETYRNNRQTFYYLKLQNRDWDAEGQLAFDNNQHWKEGGRGDGFLISQKPLDNVVLTQLQYDNITNQDERDKYSRGIFRVLACAEREEDMPSTKKHEIFIPYPENVGSWKLLEIPREVINKFEELSDQMTETVKKKIQSEINKIRQGNENKELIQEKIESIKRKLLPFEPIFTERNENARNENDFTFRLKEGDLVYFSLNYKSEIEEISLSSIWRDRRELQENGNSRGINSHDFFNLVDSELLPFNSERKQITFAEQLFGFVEEVTDKNKKAGLALAGRINFSNAKAIERADKNYLYNEWKTLKILASPKLPSPALYFKKNNGEADYNAKHELFPSKTGGHPQGRKFYLHHRQTNNWETEKETENINQKMQVQPIKKGIAFLFHIDFEQLTSLELATLLYALSPTNDFQHKIGLGKPLGLGSIKIDIEGLFLTNKVKRYSADGLFAQRYSEFWRNDEKSEFWSNLYQREKCAKQNEIPINIEVFVNEFRAKVKEVENEDLLQSIESLGNSRLNNVHYPTVLNKKDEGENFLWFVANDLKANRKGIKKIRINQEDFNNVSAKHFSLKPIIDGQIELLEDIPLKKI